MLDLSLRAMSMIGLVLKKYPFQEKQEFLHKVAYGLGQDISCTLRKHSHAIYSNTSRLLKCSFSDEMF